MNEHLDFVMIMAESLFKDQMVAARRRAGHTQAELAEILGLLEETLIEYEQPDSDLTFNEVRNYLVACGAGWKLSVVLPDE